MKLRLKKLEREKRKGCDVKVHVALHVQRGEIIVVVRETATWHGEINRGWCVIVRSSLLEPPLLRS